MVRMLREAWLGRIVAAMFFAVCASACGGQTSGAGLSSQGAGGQAGSAADGGGSGSGGASGNDAASETGAVCNKDLTFDRSCQTAADCVAAGRMVNCCGQISYMGIHQSELARFATNESACESTFPPCGCAVAYNLVDDGSKVPAAERALVTCVAGLCATYREACGAPCAAGQSCHSCTDHLMTYNACSPSCQDAPCPDSARPQCQADQWGEKFCTEASVACGTK